MFFLIVGILTVFLISLCTGTESCSLQELVQLFSGGEVSDTVRRIFFEIRLPRLLASFLIGGMLAAAGAVSQNLFRNDLASPHVLGIVNASALGAVIGLFAGGYWITPLSLAAGIFSLLILYLPGKRRNWDGTVLILAGVAVNAFTAALTSGLLYLADERLSSLVFWLLGGFWRISWHDFLILIPSAAVGFGILFYFIPEIDMLLLGDRMAELSGVPLKKLKPFLLLAVAMLTASAVSCSGVIGFVGLAIPHVIRLFYGAGFRRVLPCSILGGGFLLLLADLAARTVMSPQEIPVGILTALCGGPFFFYLLLKRRGI